jgi:hypothetical protein
MAMLTYLLLIAYIATAGSVVFGIPYLLVEREWHPVLWAALTYLWVSGTDRACRGFQPRAGHCSDRYGKQ